MLELEEERESIKEETKRAGREGGKIGNDIHFKKKSYNGITVRGVLSDLMSWEIFQSKFPPFKKFKFKCFEMFYFFLPKCRHQLYSQLKKILLYSLN
jgi:hypothetical protein